MNTLALGLLLVAELTASIDGSCEEWKSTKTSNSIFLAKRQWENVYIFFMAEENDVSFNITFNYRIHLPNFQLNEPYAYYLGDIYYKGTIQGGCSSMSPKCTSYFNFNGDEYKVGDSHISNLLITSRSLVYYLKCHSLWVLPRMPVSRGNLSLPTVKPTEVPSHDRMPVSRGNPSLPTVKPTEVPCHDLPNVLNLVLGIVVIVLFLVLLFVCIVGWRARQSAFSAKSNAAADGDPFPCHDSENSIYGMVEMPSM